MKWIIMFVFALACCWAVGAFVPQINTVLFHVGPVGVNGTILIFIGACGLVIKARR